MELVHEVVGKRLLLLYNRVRSGVGEGSKRIERKEVCV